MTAVAPQAKDAGFPPKLRCLFESWRFKVLWGGRAAGRSWGCARALLLIGASARGSAHPHLGAPLRVLCAREFQNSIAESVHKVIADQIEMMGLERWYEVQKDRIYGRPGTEAAGTSFNFEGIKNNVTRIKSYEGIDIAWVEEAVKVSQTSWGVLIPTIRKENSEIWMTFNPELETDYTYRRFVLEADSATHVEHMTWEDNPWVPAVIREEIERDRLRDPDYFLNVWKGLCLQILVGAVYAKELRRAQEDGRITIAPCDYEYPVECAFDLGRADATTIWVWQRIAMQHRVVATYGATGEDILHYVKWLQNQRFIVARIWLPHDAWHKRLGMRHSIEEVFRQQFPGCVRKVPQHSISDGINAARLLLTKCWIDERGCEVGLKGLRHYSYRVVGDALTGQLSNEPVHDWASDWADAFRYMALAAASSSRPDMNESNVIRLADQVQQMAVAGGRRAGDALGWMR